MASDYGKVGPLSILKVQGKDLMAGDVFTHDQHMKVVLRSYSREHLNWQLLDVEDGRQDKDGEFISPYHMHVLMDEEFIILRAVKEG